MSVSLSKVRQLVGILEKACKEHGFRDYMPSAMIGHFVRQVVPISFREDRLDLDQLYKWVRKEYSVPDHIFSRVFTEVRDQAAGVGIEVSLPIDYEPGFNETLVQWLTEEMRETVKSELKDELREQVKDQLSNELRPEVYRQIRTSIEHSGVDYRELDRRLLESMEAERFQAPVPPKPLKTPAAESGADEQSQTTERLKPEVEKKLREELWPLVYEEAREQIERTLRPQISSELKSEMRGQVEQELRETVELTLRDELYPRLHEQISVEIRKSQQNRASVQDGDRLGRREKRQEGPGAIKESDSDLDLSIFEARAPEAPARDNASPDRRTPPSGPGFGPDQQLKIIRRIREKLIPSIRDQVIEEITAFKAAQEEREKREIIEQKLADPDYCLEKIREFLFPDQPGLWEKVKPFIEPEQWKAIVIAQDSELASRQKLNRSRDMIREALKLKAEIGEEIHDAGEGEYPAPRQARAVRDMLTSTEGIIDYALNSISQILSAGASDREGQDI